MNQVIRPKRWTPLAIFAMIVGFILWWPLGLAVIGYILWGGSVDQLVEPFLRTRVAPAVIVLGERRHVAPQRLETQERAPCRRVACFLSPPGIVGRGGTAA